VDTHLHAFRHFSSSQGYAAGFDPVNVAAQHGHSVEMSLRTYAHVIPQRSRDLAASADRTFELRPSMPPMMALPPASETTTT
jgi:cation diffusion facilitator CzcD-associated flavoprotein CzcO